MTFAQSDGHRKKACHLSHCSVEGPRLGAFSGPAFPVLFLVPVVLSLPTTRPMPNGLPTTPATATASSTWRPGSCRCSQASASSQKCLADDCEPVTHFKMKGNPQCP
jgi:hypothetical protein